MLLLKRVELQKNYKIGPIVINNVFILSKLVYLVTIPNSHLVNKLTLHLDIIKFNRLLIHQIIYLEKLATQRLC